MCIYIFLQCCGEVCVEEVCQANESCPSFSSCLMGGQCQRSAEEKALQSSMWRLKHSNNPRKRHFSNNNEPAKRVVNHMANILSSENANWLIKTKKSEEEPNKRMKTNHLETLAPAKKSSAILYQPPQTSWVLDPPQVCQKEDFVEDFTQVYQKEDFVDDFPQICQKEDFVEDFNKNISNWLLSSKELVNKKKANCEKENSLYRACLFKSQLSLNSFGSIENVKDKIEKIDSDFKKDKWLLQQSIKADNKILEEVMNSKCEWLSNSSMTSFSIISEPEVAQCNSWLLSQ